jgi:phage FluMu protein Com
MGIKEKLKPIKKFKDLEKKSVGYVNSLCPRCKRALINHYQKYGHENPERINRIICSFCYKKLSEDLKNDL